MRRTIFVGDVHGCRDELVALLEKVGLGDEDRLVMVGDLVVRGPEPAATLDLLLKLGARAVRGNHDDRLLRWRADPSRPLNEMQRATVEALRTRHWDFLASLPLWLDLDDGLVRVVHAGLVPGVPIEKQAARTLMYIRTLDAAGAPSEKREIGRPWGASYVGPPHVVFGHNAAREPQLHPWATCIDTSCVYGGRLTALVLPIGTLPPPPGDRADALVSVPARRRYAED